MTDYPQLITQLEQQSAALEAALSHQEWELTETLVASRLQLLKLLSSQPPTEPILLARLKELAVSIQLSETELVRQIEASQLEVADQLRGLLAGSKASNIYQQNR